ncbi:TauD/TfdA family dioxygenase [Dongia deserti]|uniref:TauD/TfdA family dioxygenase n=1 Tax=Dongia deserti TaxID=2268030 RepID=UPI000E65763E|nr:TauD/TfdA family dioxygenase [Dongia deserti]
MDLEPDLGLPKRIAWDSQLGPINTLTWTSEYAPERSLEQIEHFLKYGFVVLREVPTKPGSILDVARRFGYPRETNFGLLFEVKSIPEANDLAYTGLGLDAHTDNPYRDPVPGVQLLHCLINESTGGLSTLVDGYAVVERIRAIDPGAYEILSNIPVRFIFRDLDGDYTDYAPIIEHDHAGTFSGIRFSPRLDFVPLLPPQELDRFYAARRLLDRALRSSEFEIKFLLSPGELVMFDNRRLLHGRTAFDPRSGLRHLQGCYIDRDAIESQYRVLSRKLQARGPK